MPCPGNNLQEVVGKMAHDNVEVIEIKLTLFGRHQKRCVCLTLPCLQDWLPSPSTQGKWGCHRWGLLGWGAHAACRKAEPPDPAGTSLCRRLCPASCCAALSVQQLFMPPETEASPRIFACPSWLLQVWAPALSPRGGEVRVCKNACKYCNILITIWKTRCYWQWELIFPRQVKIKLFIHWLNDLNYLIPSLSPLKWKQKVVMQ